MDAFSLFVPRPRLPYILLISSLLILTVRCQPAPEVLELKDALTFYASFDEGFTADYAKGDPVLYTSLSQQNDSTVSVITGEEGLVVQLVDAGRYGGALRFSTDWNPVVFFNAENNVAYDAENWSGAFAFWLRIDPDAGLAEGYSDPFIITDKNWDNASLYVDFTDTIPRHFRFAAFADHFSWNPEGLAWEDVSAEERPMIDLAEHPFAADLWTHVVLTFEHVNADAEAAHIQGYINGELAGSFERPIPITWDQERVMMMIGRHYAGDFDECQIAV